MKRAIYLLFGFLISINLQAQTVTEIVENSGDHETLEIALAAAGLDDDLRGAGPFTLFAPTDQAFAALGSVVNELLLDPTGDLKDILEYHVLSGEVASSAVTNGLIATPLFNGNTLKFTNTNTNNLFVNHATITVRDIAATNGVVHVIDAVVVPAETVVDVAIDNGFTTLADAVIAAELLPVLTDPFSTFTVFAPTNDAFDALGTTVNDLLQDPTGDLQDILLYHVLEAEVEAAAVMNGMIADAVSTTNTLKLTKTGDGDVFVNQAEVTMADVGADNGIVHVINAVVLPVETVVDVAIDNSFNTLTTAVVAAELLPALTDPFASYTVFAPTDDAFDALGSTVNDLLQDPTGDLQDILLYHVLDSEVDAASVTNGLIADALSTTNTLKLTKTGGGDVFVNQAEVTMADVGADNGIVHVINAVVLPVETVVDVAIDNSFNTLTTAVVAAELLPALTDPFASYTVFAPTDDAFDALGSTVNDLLQDPTGDLQDILLYHVLDSEVDAAGVTNGLIADALSTTNTLKLTKTGDGDVFVNQAEVTMADVGADNGVVHVINAVVLPVETVVDVAIDNSFNTLTTAVVAAELLPALTDPFASYTVFAPTDDAFDALGTTVNDLLQDPTGDLQDILLYHVLDSEVDAASVTNGLIADALSTTNTLKLTKTGDGDVFVNQAEVTMADVGADNGIVHVINAVVLPIETVVDVAIDNDFTTLTTAVAAAELLPALTDPAGTYTVFAPTNDAFDELGTTLNDLLQDPTGDLKNILLYHVLGSEVFSSQLSDGQTAETLEGSNITVTIDGMVISINDAEVALADVGSDNGVVHVIGKVLTPITSSTENLDAVDSGILISPNPADDQLMITFESDIPGEKTVRIFDVQGKELYQSRLTDYQTTLNVNELNSGMYLMSIQLENGINYFQKISIKR